MRNLHREITDKILAQLATGVAPWRKPWSELKTASGGSVWPFNAATGRAYSGVNVLLLWSAAQAQGWSPRWITFKQAKEAGGTVRKGERGEMVIFVKQMLVDDKDRPGEKKRIGFLRNYIIFNVAQCDGLPARMTGVEATPAQPVDRNVRDPQLDAFVKATGAVITEGGSMAAYSQNFDRIAMPPLGAFESSDYYYATLFHEMGHWTGHKSRMDRDLRGRFGDRAYAVEELIAELTSAFVCAEFGIDMQAAPASYIDNWVSVLTERETAIVTAAAAASKAVEYLRGKVAAEEADEAEEASEAA